MGSVPATILSRGPIADLVEASRFEEALARLHEERERRPGDGEITDAIRTVRDRALRQALERLGSLEAVPRALGAAPADLSPDEGYLLRLVDGAATIDQLLDSSTLGRLRTARGLVALLGRSAIVTSLPHGSSAPAPAPATATAARRVLVADGQAASAALTRTLLRIVLGGTAALETVAGSAELVSAASAARPELVVVELMLPGGDGLTALRTLRRSVGASVPALVIASRAELDFATGRAPERCVVLSRPIEKAALIEALRTLGIAGARRG